MVAFSASRLVWLAIAPIRRSTSPIFSAAEARLLTISVVCPALTTALSATWLEWVTWRPISATEDASSSVAAATALTLPDASSEAAAAAAARCEVPLDAGRDFAGRTLHVGCCLRDRGDDALDVGLEAVGHLALQGLLLEFGLMLGGLLRLAHAARLDHAAAEHVDRASHGAEFIVALAARDRDVDFAAGKAVHDRRDGRQWP